jgi:hypothetical protein
MPWIGLPVNLLDIIVLMLVGLVSIVLPVVGVVIIARKRRIKKAEMGQTLSPVFNSIASISSVCICVCAYLLIVWGKGAEWSQLGVVPVEADWYWKSLLVLISVYLVILAVVVLISWLLPLIMDVKKVEKKLDKKHGFKLDSFSLSGLFGYAVLVPIAEEIVFRGVLYGWLRLSLSIEASVAISAIVFGIAHGIGFNGMMTLLGGVGFALLYEYSGSILPGILVHMVNNAVAISVPALIARGILFKGLTNPKNS